jgi:hypothetical protein
MSDPEPPASIVRVQPYRIFIMITAAPVFVLMLPVVWYLGARGDSRTGADGFGLTVVFVVGLAVAAILLNHLEAALLRRRESRLRHSLSAEQLAQIAREEEAYYEATGRREEQARLESAERTQASTAAQQEVARAREQRKAARASADAERLRKFGEQRQTQKTPLSQVAQRADGGGLICPRCGGTQWRRGRRRLGAPGAATVATVYLGPIGGIAASAAGGKSTVVCVTCGAKFQRG